MCDNRRYFFHFEDVSFWYEKIVFDYAERTSIEDIESLHLEKAKEIYILGEDATAENEEDHDAYNIDCLENISKYMSKDDVKIYRKEKLNNENGNQNA